MYTRSGEAFNATLATTARLTEVLVPKYDIKQSDPIEASRSGIGNCLAKSAISAIMLERMKLVGPRPAIGYNSKTHPKYFDSVIKRQTRGNGHAFLFAASGYTPNVIGGLSFNPFGDESDHWRIEDFSHDEPKIIEVTADGRHITATQTGIETGFVIADWYRGAQLYQEALGITDDVYHTTSEQVIGESVIAHLVDREVLMDIRRFD